MYCSYNRLNAAVARIGLGLIFFLLAGCRDVTSIDGVSVRSVRLASTTSTRDSGLLDVLLPVFEQQHACRVDLFALGTGAALKLGEQGEVDAVLCHAPAAEAVFMQARHGIRREPVMHNSFLIAGPENDPAHVKGLDAIDALKQIAASESRFASRGDNSGTHQREQLLWEHVGECPSWHEYVETGQGMGATLVIADEMNAYVLVDEATWLKRSGDLRLVPITTRGENLKNPYAIIVVDPTKHASINGTLANALADFLTSASTQRLIAKYQVNGRSLFHPDRLSEHVVAESVKELEE